MNSFNKVKNKIWNDRIRMEKIKKQLFSNKKLFKHNYFKRLTNVLLKIADTFNTNIKRSYDIS